MPSSPYWVTYFLCVEPVEPLAQVGGSHLLTFMALRIKLLKSAGKPGLSSQVLSPQSNPGATQVADRGMTFS